MKDRINDHMTERIKSHHRLKNITTNYTRPLMQYKTKTKEPEEFNDSTDYEAMWDIAIDKWTRNWNYYSEKLTDSILSNLHSNHKRQRWQTNIDLIELTSQTKTPTV